MLTKRVRATRCRSAAAADPHLLIVDSRYALLEVRPGHDRGDLRTSPKFEAQLGVVHRRRSRMRSNGRDARCSIGWMCAPCLSHAAAAAWRSLNMIKPTEHIQVVRSAEDCGRHWRGRHRDCDVCDRHGVWSDLWSSRASRESRRRSRRDETRHRDGDRGRTHRVDSGRGRVAVFNGTGCHGCRSRHARRERS